MQEQTALIDYTQLTTALSSNFKLPGGIELDTDFQRYYLTEAAKAFMGLHSDFSYNQNGQQISNKKLIEKVTPILRHFNVIKESDESYELFRRMFAIKSKFSNESLEHENEYKQALEKIKEAHILLEALNNKYASSEDAMNSDDLINKFMEENNMTKEELLSKIS